jgi:precorrin-2 dehydrogenase / sirohydrochlorin ferrochelatase
MTEQGKIQMQYYPINLNIYQRKCLVVGGGGVASRKVKTLLSCGGDVTVISPDVCEALTALAAEDRIHLICREYRKGDVKGYFLVIGATSDMNVNRQISADAENQNMLCNIADVPEICNFILPAVVRRDDLVIAVSTSGQSPAFAKNLRKELEAAFGEEYARFLTLMGAIRKRLLCRQHDPAKHKSLFEALINRGLLGMVRENRQHDIDRLLAEILGENYTCEDLMSEDASTAAPARPPGVGPSTPDPESGS